MASTYIQPGDVLEIIATAAISSNDVVKTGSLIGVALGDAAIGETARISICGVFEASCPSAEDITQGAPLYFDEAEGVVKLDDETGANALAGYAFGNAGAGVTTVAIKLLH